MHFPITGTIQSMEIKDYWYTPRHITLRARNFHGDHQYSRFTSLLVLREHNYVVKNILLIPGRSILWLYETGQRPGITMVGCRQTFLRTVGQDALSLANFQRPHWWNTHRSLRCLRNCAHPSCVCPYYLFNCQILLKYTYCICILIENIFQVQNPNYKASLAVKGMHEIIPKC